HPPQTRANIGLWAFSQRRRLIVLGAGEERARLHALAQELAEALGMLAQVALVIGKRLREHDRHEGTGRLDTRNLDVLDRGAELAQGRQRLLESLLDLGVNVLEEVFAGHAD